MRRRVARALADEAGIAMITVLLVGSVLTVTATAAMMYSVKELRASADSGRGSAAVAHAEAGLEQFLSELRRGSFALSAVMKAGCSGPPVTFGPGVVGTGTYSAELTVFTPSSNPAVPEVPPSPWTAANASSPPCQGRSLSARTPQLYAVSATGVAGSGSRTVRSIVTISGSALPVGVFVNSINASGNPSFANVSVFASGDIYGREKLAFTGNDLFYFMGDVYPGQSMTTPIPAAAHAVGAIYATINTKKGVIHPPNPNCSANPRGTAGQSLWDGSGTGGSVSSGCTGQTGFPPTAKFTEDDLKRILGRSSATSQLAEAEYTSLKAAAQATGIYCGTTVGGVTSCTKNGVTWTKPAVITSGDIAGLKNFVAYFEYEGGNPFTQDVSWDATVGPCSSDPALNNSAVLVVRNGGVKLRGGGYFYGNIVASDGLVDAAGGYRVTGSVMAKEMRLRGSATFGLDACAVANPASPLMKVTAGRWTEVDR